MKAKKLISAIVALALFISPLSDYLPILGEGMKVSAETMTLSDIQSKINAMVAGNYGNSYKAGNTFSGSYSGKFKVTENGISKTHWNSNSYQCMGFAKMAFEKIFEGKGTTAKQITYTGDYSNTEKMAEWVKNNALPGDYLRWGDGGTHSSSGWGHSVVIYSVNDDGLKIYDANGGKLAQSNPNIIQFRDMPWGSDTQAYSFKYKAVGTNNGGLYLIRHDSVVNTLDLTTTPLNLGDQFLAAIQSSDGTKALTVDSNNNVSIQKYVGTPNQTWMFTRTDGNYYEIKNPATGKCLDAANGGNADYTNIQVWEDNDTSSQRYGIYGSQNSYVMRVKHSSVLVVDAGAARNNVNLYTYSPNIAAQKFRIFCLFDNVSVTNITSTNALVAAKFHKPSEAKALSYDISVSTSSSMQNAVTHSCKPSSTNVGSTSRDITFDFVKEYNHYLSPNTTYYYRFTGKYDISGKTVSYTSSVYSFKTLAGSTSDSSVTIKSSTTHFKNTITNTNAILYGEVDKPSSYPVTKIGIRLRVDGSTYDKGWSKYEAPSRSYTGYTYMCPVYNMNTELKLTLTHATKYYYQFYAVVNGKEYWSPEGSFTTTGSHSYGAWKTTKPATCTESGVQTRSCSCGKTETQTIPATGHSYGAWTTTKAPTCTDSGIQTRSCTKCGDTQTQTIAAKGHSYSSGWTVDVQPTCTADGSKSHHCTVCGAKKDITSIPALGHNYKVTVVAPTAYSDGYTLHQCTRCPYNYKDNYVHKILLGDIDGNGKINSVDARWVLQAISGKRTLTAEQQAAADVNNDGKINTTDAKWILQDVSGKRELD